MFTPSLPTADLDHVLAQTRALWEELRGGRLFLTGGTGFFGVWLVETFLWANERLDLEAEAVVLSRDPAAFLERMPHLNQESALAFQPGSMHDFEFPAGEFSHVIHAATEYGGPKGFDQAAAFDRDVRGTRRVLEFAGGCGAKRFLFTSSGAVYGRQPAETTRIGEDCGGAPDPLDPGAGYGLAKRASEFFCAEHARTCGLEAKIARCFAFVGPYLPLDANYAVGNFLRDALAGGPILVQGDGTPYRSYLYAADLAVWLWTLLFRGPSCRAYNVGSDEQITIAELAQAVADVAAPSAEIRVAEKPRPGEPPPRYVPATDKARADLGLTAKIGLRDALGRTAAWQRREALSCARGGVLQ